MTPAEHEAYTHLKSELTYNDGTPLEETADETKFSIRDLYSSSSKRHKVEFKFWDLQQKSSIYSRLQ